jgi:hypothetical protein
MVSLSNHEVGSTVRATTSSIDRLRMRSTGHLDRHEGHFPGAFQRQVERHFPGMIG